MWSRPLYFSRWLRRVVLVAVGVLGLSLTVWVDRELARVESERLEQRFKALAMLRADALIDRLCQPLDHLGLLQRVFDSIERVSWPAFQKVTEPMLGQPGIGGFAWFPRISKLERRGFEESGQALWGREFRIWQDDRDGKPIAAGPREHYFPELYGVPKVVAREFAGFDLLSDAPRAAQLSRALEAGRPLAGVPGALGPALARADTLLLMAPVYHRDRAGRASAAPGESVLGVVVGALYLEDLFRAAVDGAPGGELQVRLLDVNDGATVTLVDWLPQQAAPNDGGATLLHSESFDMAGRSWQVQVRAAAQWQRANGQRGLGLILPGGILVTGLLLIILGHLMRRSAHTDSLERSHRDVLVGRQAAEAWANKLQMAVEQSPATVFITDLEGCFEYVNDKFVEVTGYRRDEVIGQNSNVLWPVDADGLIYQHMWESVRRGETWHGEVQTRRCDGSVFWERMLFAPIKAPSGVITHYVALKEDVTELRRVSDCLQESESRFRAAMSVIVDGLVVLSADGTYAYANRAAEEFMGCATGGMQGRRPEDMVVERICEDGSPCAAKDDPSLLSLRDGVEVRNAVLGVRVGDRDVRWLLVNASPLGSGADARRGVVMTLSDITERRRAEEQLRLAFEAIRCSGEGIVVTDAAQRIISVNPAFEAVTGYSAAEIAGKTPEMVISVRPDSRSYEEIQVALRNTGHWQGEVWNQRKNGEVFPEWLGVSVVRERDGQPKYFVYIFSDMTERQEAQRRIEMLAHHDPLTGLPNRLLLRDRADQARAQAARLQSRFALMFLDLDRFKTINDSLGHPVGDALLKEIVERLKGCVRESDTISRQGGDEFIILLNDVRDSEAVSRVAEKIQQRMSEALVLENHLLRTSFSIGIALYPDDGDDFDILLQKADTAMYHAKEAGRNAHRFFAEEMNQKVVEHLKLETELRNALENGEFVLHYQPQIDLHDGRIVGVEALVRWNSPRDGLVYPGKFMPVAEDSGLIVPIGAWVLGEACRQAQRWQQAGLHPFVVAVNLSAVQFKRMDLINTVINALVLADLDAEWLELELTESILIQDTEVILDTVRRLKALGVKLSVDDFGTGYSSLAYLKRFAVDKLKIDQSFVRDLLNDPDDAAIVRAIIQMAHSLKLRTIAEGVENEDLANLLKMFHCDEVQGYWLARPMPADELERFVRNHVATRCGEH